MPLLGLGVMQIPDEKVPQAMREATELGYRLFDTAPVYRNEPGTGRGVKECGLPREDVFVTTKLWNGRQGYDEALRAFDESIEALGLEYLDLYLIHWPCPAKNLYVDSWKALIRLREEGRVRSIGVSNFHAHHIDRLLAETGTVPAVNQIEAHPYLTQDDLRRYDREHGIGTEAWSPIAQGKVLGAPVIAKVAAASGKSPAQVVLRWHIQRGDIIFPKSVTPSRMQENFEIFDFALSDEDVAAITALNRNERTGPDPDTFNWLGPPHPRPA